MRRPTKYAHIAILFPRHSHGACLVDSSRHGPRRTCPGAEAVHQETNTSNEGVFFFFFFFTGGRPQANQDHYPKHPVSGQLSRLSTHLKYCFTQRLKDDNVFADEYVGVSSQLVFMIRRRQVFDLKPWPRKRLFVALLAACLLKVIYVITG